MKFANRWRRILAGRSRPKTPWPGRWIISPEIRSPTAAGRTLRPITRRIAGGITRTRWAGCDLERIYNRTIGHEWPKLGPYNTSAEVWRFVSRYRR